MRRLIEDREQHLTEMKVSVVGFVNGQEPDDTDDEWAGDIEVKGTIQGREVAQLLGKQQRVVQKALEKLGSKKALALISNGGNKVSKGIMSAVKAQAKRFANEYAMDEFDRRAKVDDVEFGSDESSWSAKIDPKKEQIDFEIDFGMTGTWK